jgi:hypothetical protein
VARAIQIRDIVTSLGPAYIKLGQALSIRPDLLSPAAMRELQASRGALEQGEIRGRGQGGGAAPWGRGQEVGGVRGFET